MSPQRIQRQRTRGWRMPQGAVYVGRPTVYGNPWTLADASHLPNLTEAQKWQWAVNHYEHELYERGGTGEDQFIRLADLQTALRGKDLACWCPLDRPCHADILLRVANKEASHVG